MIYKVLFAYIISDPCCTILHGVISLIWQLKKKKKTNKTRLYDRVCNLVATGRLLTQVAKWLKFMMESQLKVTDFHGKLCISNFSLNFQGLATIFS